MDNQNGNQGSDNSSGVDQGTPPATEPTIPATEEKCMKCGNASTGGNCVTCGQGQTYCTCQPTPPQGGSDQGGPVPTV